MNTSERADVQEQQQQQQQQQLDDVFAAERAAGAVVRRKEGFSFVRVIITMLYLTNCLCVFQKNTNNNKQLVDLRPQAFFPAKSEHSLVVIFGLLATNSAKQK